MLGKKVLKMTPPSIQKFNLEDMGKLVAIIAASQMTQEYLIKQKILPEHINVSRGIGISFPKSVTTQNTMMAFKKTSGIGWKD